VILSSYQNVESNLRWWIRAESLAGEAATVTYLIPKLFLEPLSSLLRLLSARHFNITGRLDISARRQQELLFAMAPCLVLFVSPSPTLDDAFTADSCAVAVAPFHVVVSDHGRQAEIHVLRRLPSDCGSLKPPTVAALTRRIPKFCAPLKASECRGAYDQTT
jgi:hypothetical protein